MSCSGGTNKVGMIAAARTGKLDGASISLSLSHKSKRWESPLHSPLLPIHSFIHISIHCYLPSIPFQNRRQNENGEMKRTTFQLSDWKPSPLFLNSYPPRGVRARSTTNHVLERERERDREGGKEGELQFLRRSRMSVWRALFS